MDLPPPSDRSALRSEVRYGWITGLRTLSSVSSMFYPSPTQAPEIVGVEAGGFAAQTYRSRNSRQ